MARSSGDRGATTSVDVARRAGVSQSTVSLVFGGKADGRVGPRTQEAIFQAARELRYKPNVAARTLRSGQSRILVLVVPNSNNPYFAGALRGAEREARKWGYSVTLATVWEESDWQPVVVDVLLSRAVEGFLIFGMEPPSIKEKRILRGKAILVDASHRNFPSIVLDLKDGVRSALIHLIEEGHTKIGHLAASIDVETFAVRRQAYLHTLERAGLRFQSSHEVQSPFHIDSATDAASQLLAQKDRPSAVFCDSDVLAVGVFKAAKELGLNIPRDLSVVGVDDSIVARILEPELTTIAVPAEKIGETAVRLMLDVLRGNDTPARTTIPLKVMIRNSTGPLKVRGQRQGAAYL